MVKKSENAIRNKKFHRHKKIINMLWQQVCFYITKIIKIAYV